MATNPVPDDRLRSVNAFIVGVLNEWSTPDKRYTYELQARREHCERLLSIRNTMAPDDSATRFLTER